MAQSKRAVVIGGGIGGLTAAAALHRSGWDVTVLERAPSLEPVGAAISLAPNSLRALDVIGLGDEIRDLAAWQGDGGVRTPSGRWLSRTDADAVATRFGGPLVLLHRATLVNSLAALLPPGTVRTGISATVTDPGDAGRPARVATSDDEMEADLVVAADGIRSAVRPVLFADHPGTVYSGFTTWRVVIPVPGAEFASHETWGRGRIWGSHPLKDGRVYAYAAAMTPPRSALPTTRRPNCSAATATGTTRSPRSSPPPAPRTSCVTTSTTSPSRCPPTTAGGSPWSGTPRTPCRRCSGRAATRPSRTPWSSPTTARTSRPTRQPAFRVRPPLPARPSRSPAST